MKTEGSESVYENTHFESQVGLAYSSRQKEINALIIDLRLQSSPISAHYYLSLSVVDRYSRQNESRAEISGAFGRHKFFDRVVSF